MLTEVFSSGGGTQSTAIAALIIQRELPKPDVVVIADTERECATTWQYLDEVVAPALRGFGIEVHRIKGWSTNSSIASKNGNTLLVPAWTDENGDVGKLPGFCSNKWKVEAMDRWLSKTKGLTRSKYRAWIGLSFDEWRRAQRLMAGEEGRKGLIWLPLLSGLHMKRQESIQLVKDMGWPEPPRSRCWMCPNQSDSEWRDLKENHHEDFMKAVAFEQEMQQFDAHAWLHKECKPIDEVDFFRQPDLFDSGNYCSSGVCFV
jgi:3'-phosphoadenosine 5'-phosphosulfate sulfotransferase (PAPS reductase)/FAD synthetase